MPRICLLAWFLTVAALFGAELPTLPLADGLRSRYVDNNNGLTMHIIEAGDASAAECVILLHGFPELAYSWRKVMPALAAAGLHVVAPDQRGFGRTMGNDNGYDVDLAQFRMLNRVRDVVGLVHSLGRKRVYVAGHDAGSPVAAWCALVRPDVFTKLVMITSPFRGPPTIINGKPPVRDSIFRMNEALAKLSPPRKHYQWYYTTRQANDDMMNAAQGRLHDIPAGQESGADGMALDRDDRVYVTTVTGIQVFEKTGHYLGTLSVPRKAANAAFSGKDKRTLFITAREGLYRLPMLAQGPERPGK